MSESTELKVLKEQNTHVHGLLVKTLRRGVPRNVSVTVRPANHAGSQVVVKMTRDEYFFEVQANSIKLWYNGHEKALDLIAGMPKSVQKVYAGILHTRVSLTEYGNTKRLEYSLQGKEFRTMGRHHSDFSLSLDKMRARLLENLQNAYGHGGKANIKLTAENGSAFVRVEDKPWSVTFVVANGMLTALRPNDRMTQQLMQGKDRPEKLQSVYQSVLHQAAGLTTYAQSAARKS